MSDPIEFALKPGAQRGDSAFLLNRGRHRLAFDSFPGRTIALAFLGSADDPGTDAALQTFAAHRRLAEDGKAAFFAVASEPDPAARSALETRFPSVRFLWDGESLATAFGVARAWVVLDPMLRVVEVAPLDERERVMGRLDRAAAPSQAFGDFPPAPILLLAAVALEAVDEMAAKLGLENVGKREDRRRRGIAEGLARRPGRADPHC